jgi:uncharacterized delta-60 repeat protein
MDGDPAVPAETKPPSFHTEWGVRLNETGKGNWLLNQEGRWVMKLTQKGSGTHTSVWRRAGHLALVVVMAASLVGAGTVLAAGGDLGWASSAGGGGQDFGNGIAALSDGGALVTGRFLGTATFGAGEVNETTLTSDPASQDICVARYAPDGTLAWAKSAGANGKDDLDEGNGIAAPTDGSAIVTGHFQGTATFGAGEANETLLTSAGSYDVFIAKYNPGGTLAWVTSAGGGNFDVGHAVAILSEEIDEIIVESIVVTGRFQDTATFGAGEDNETLLTSAGSRDIFVAKYNQDGTLAWATRAGGSSFDEGNSVSTAPNGSILVSGSFLGTTAFDGTTLTSAGSVDIFVAKYNPDGTLLWATKAGGATEDRGTGVAALDDGGALVSGYFSASDGSYDVLVAKYNAAGTPAWVTEAGGTDSNAMAYSIAALPDGSALVTGSFDGTATFDGTALTSDGSLDVFVAQYDPDGTLIWAKRAGGVGLDEGFAVAALSEGNTLVTGDFEGEATFDGTTLTSAGLCDIFVARFGGQLEVEIDIKPGAYPNNINLGSHGLIPVAIISSVEFDATEVDPATVALAGASVAIRGRGSRLMAHEEDVNEDGFLDLVIQVETENLDPNQFQDGYASLTGETYDGVAVIGWDEIRIVPVE